MAIRSRMAGWTLGSIFVAFAALVGAENGGAVAYADDAPPCDDVDIEYALSANLGLSDTPMGQGDGSYHVGPGTTVVRFHQKDGAPDGAAKMLSYAITERFTINAKTLFWNTRVTTDGTTTVAKDACGVVATASLSGHTLSWTSDARGAHTDGTLTCEGSMCGKFGAPPPGNSPLHIPPQDARFQPWVFSSGMKTFSMANTLMSKTDTPKQTAHIALSGREVRRTCSTAPACQAPAH